MIRCEGVRLCNEVRSRLSMAMGVAASHFPSLMTFFFLVRFVTDTSEAIEGINLS